MLDLNKIESIKAEKKPKEFSGFGNILDKEIKFGSKKLSDKKKENFYGELSMLLGSGIDIRTAFSIILEQQKKGKDRELFERLVKGIVEGKSLSESIETENSFSKYEIFSIKIGEETGKLVRVLEDLAGYYTDKVKQRRKLISAFSYPAMVMATAILVVVFMLNFIVPMFEGIFTRFNQDLPMLTRWVVNISKGFNNNSGLLLFSVVAIVVAVLFVRKKSFYKRFSSRLMLKIPIVGEMLKAVYLGRFCQSMALLTGSGVPLLRAVRLTQQMISFYPLQKALSEIENDILHGEMLFKSMEKFSLFEGRLVALTKLGEEVNQLEKIYSQLHKQYVEELSHKTSILNNTLEPLLIIVIGGMVAIILIAMYLPMFKMGGTMF
jgi:type IV pilus assembly protein PilC